MKKVEFFLHRGKRNRCNETASRKTCRNRCKKMREMNGMMQKRADTCVHNFEKKYFQVKKQEITADVAAFYVEFLPGRKEEIFSCGYAFERSWKKFSVHEREKHYANPFCP